jgi:hypothetical protein
MNVLMSGLAVGALEIILDSSVGVGIGLERTLLDLQGPFAFILVLVTLLTADWVL